MDYGEEIARVALEIKAIKLQPDNPFTWASGFRMPIYNDNRLLLDTFQHRSLLDRGFRNILTSEGLSFDVIAGTSTAGIPPATTLSNSLGKSLIYVRDKPKDHGLGNRIEGIDSESGLKGRNVLLIEDLISTGGSSASAVQAIRDADGNCDYCFSIFDYGLNKAVQAFKNLNPNCKVSSLLTYDVLIKVALGRRDINAQQLEMLDEWRADPFGWGEKHGFPKVER